RRQLIAERLAAARGEYGEERAAGERVVDDLFQKRAFNQDFSQCFRKGVRHGDMRRTLAVACRGEAFDITLDGATVRASGSLNPRGLLLAEIGGNRLRATVVVAGERRHVFARGHTWVFACVDPLDHGFEAAGAEGGLLAPMPGKVIALLAAPGDEVEKGAPLLILEAMKMEHAIAAPAAGRVRAFRFRVGDQVGDGAELVDFEVAEVATR
ncbi:MAG: 3-methylcrotonyl-CoA carboxylase, partial [Zoogloea sp.]|nr:3-methylcrotonyl-CoA carboxylase [Zoogloea sp.]